MATTLPAKGFFTRTAEYDVRNWAALEVPDNIQFSDVFDPAFWRHHATKFQPNDLIRMRRVDGAWDFTLNVVAKEAGGLLVETWPKWPTEEDAAEAEAEKARPIEPRQINGQIVPRVEHTPATKWRVIGLDGNEYKRGFATKEKAEEALRVYAASFNREIAA